MKQLLLCLVTACASSPSPAPFVIVNLDQPDTPVPPPMQADQTTMPYRGIIGLTVPGPGEDGTSYGATFTQANVNTYHFCEWGVLAGNCCFSAHPTYSDPAQVSAGDLTLVDLTTGEHTMSSFHDDPNGLDYEFYGVLAPPVGDTLQISAAGDTVHAFTVGATIPPPLTGLPAGFAPLSSWDSNGDSFGISLAHNYGVTWTPAGSGLVDVQLQSEEASVECRSDDASGGLVIHKSILESLYAPGQYVDVAVNRLTRASGDSDNAEVTLEVQIGYGWMGNAELVP